jgi:hypothetical protein
VKGFTEALITDLRINAPHIRCSVVMPGHIVAPATRALARMAAATSRRPVSCAALVSAFATSASSR